jgi:hypothetical protein
MMGCAYLEVRSRLFKFMAFEFGMLTEGAVHDFHIADTDMRLLSCACISWLGMTRSTIF